MAGQGLGGFELLRSEHLQQESHRREVPHAGNRAQQGAAVMVAILTAEAHKLAVERADLGVQPFQRLQLDVRQVRKTSGRSACRRVSFSARLQW